MYRPATDGPVTVLLIDDDEDDYIIVKQVFKKIYESPFKLEWCASYEKAKQLIENHTYDIYLIDYHLGEHSGLDLLASAHPHERPEPFIMLTGVGDRETEKRSIQLGAADYLVKGAFGAELLSRTLNYSLGRKQNEQQRLDHLLELNRSKDEFISLASHQLRTPATGVKQYLGMVLEGFAGDISPTQRGLLEKAYESNDRQLRIVSDLLKVAQVDAGKVNLNAAETDMGVMISDVIREQAKTFKDRKQTVNFTLPSLPLLAFVDKDRIRMVIENILDNASKYSDHGKAIDIDLAEMSADILVTIKDQGVGIAEVDLDRLFAKFSRIHNPLSTHVDGTGLGLYWAQKIVALHRGTIDVQAVEAEGATFVINLPKAHRPLC